MDWWVLALVAPAAVFGELFWQPRITAWLEHKQFQRECTHPRHMWEEMTPDFILDELIYRCTRCGKQLHRDDTGGKIKPPPRD